MKGFKELEEKGGVVIEWSIFSEEEEINN